MHLFWSFDTDWMPQNHSKSTSYYPKLDWNKIRPLDLHSNQFLAQIAA